MTTGSIRQSVADAIFGAMIIGVIIITAVRVLPLDYGSLDAIGSLHTWQTALRQGIYQPSRFQGYLVPEMLTGWLGHRFGPIGPNLLVFVISALSVFFFYLFVSRFCGKRNAFLAALVIASNPVWLLSSLTGTDYIYSAMLMVLGALLIQRRLEILGVLAFGLATGMRINFLPLGLGACALLMWRQPTQNRRSGLQLLLVYVVVSAAFYIPVWIASHLSLGFLGAAAPLNNGLAARMARFIWKTSNFFGLPALLIVLAITALALLRRREQITRMPALIALGLIAFGLVTLLSLPANPTYLFPTLFGLAFLFAWLDTSRWMICILCAAQLFSAFWRPDFLEISYAVNAACTGAPLQPSGARLHLHMTDGAITDYIHHLNDITCQFDRLDVEKPLFHFERVHKQ